MQKLLMSPCLSCPHLERKSTKYVLDEGKHWRCSYVKIPTAIAWIEENAWDILIEEKNGEITCYNAKQPIKHCAVFNKKGVVNADFFQTLFTRKSEEIEQDLEDVNNGFADDEETEEDRYYREKEAFEASLTKSQYEKLQEFYSANDE